MESLFQGPDQGTERGQLKKKTEKVVKVSAAPVTHAEAQKTFERVWKTLSKGLKAKGPNPVKLSADGQPVTKDEVLQSIKVVVAQVEPLFKRSASPLAFKPQRFRKDLNQGAYSKLVRDGFVMPVGPLVVGKNGPLSTYEFGDAIGVLLVRISDLVHMPTRKFSPNLMR